MEIDIEFTIKELQKIITNLDDADHNVAAAYLSMAIDSLSQSQKSADGNDYIKTPNSD